MKIESFINKKATKFLKEIDNSLPIGNKIVVEIYENALKWSKKIDTPRIIGLIIERLNNYFFKITQKNADKEILGIDFTFLGAKMGIARNGFVLNGLTIFMSGKYHVLLSCTSKKIQIDVLIHELVHVYIDCLMTENLPSTVEALELKVEEVESIVLEEVTKWIEN